MKERKRLAGFLILALAIAAGYAIFRPRPDLVPYTTPWISNEKQLVRIHLLIPRGWVGEEDTNNTRLVISPREDDSSWGPQWLKWLLRIEEARKPLRSDETPDGILIDGGCCAGSPRIADDTRYLDHVYLRYSRENQAAFNDTARRILDSARIIERRPLHR